MFDATRMALMRGDHPRRHEPVPARRYALLIDVGGEDEAPGGALDRRTLENPRRDATALTVVDVESSGQRPMYRTVDRRLWLGVRHSALYEQITALTHHWGAGWVVVDATGVGAGLASFLQQALPGRVIPVTFSPQVKSDLGWGFLAVVETGRYRDYVEDGAADTRQFWYEVAHCERQVGASDAKALRWGVWESPAYDGLIARGHDDLLLSAALCAILDRQARCGTGASAVVEAPDLLGEVDRASW
jgi:hypothetical protein